MKASFLNNEIFVLTCNGSFQRNKIYKLDTSDEERKALRNELRSRLTGLEEKYTNGEVRSEDHINIIEKLSDEMSRSFGDCLTGKRFRIGTCQKALNLYLTPITDKG